MPRKHSNLSVARIGRAERAGQALDLRKAGLTFKKIGDRMGVTEQRAHKMVTDELARLNSKRSENAEAVTRLELERLDALIAAIWPKAEQGDLTAIDRVLAIMARRAKMLGIDQEKPSAVTQQQVNVNVEVMSDADRAMAIQAILQRTGHVLPDQPAPLGESNAGPHSNGQDDAARPLLGRPGEVNGRCRDDAGPLADDVPLLYE
jgi:hypothetical protein